MALLSPNAKWVFPTKYHLKEACLLRHVNLRAALNSPIGERNPICGVLSPFSFT